MHFKDEHYPPSRLANPVCRACHWYCSRTHTCDYYIKTGQRKKGVGKSCDSYKLRDGDAKRYINRFN